MFFESGAKHPYPYPDYVLKVALNTLILTLTMFWVRVSVFSATFKKHSQGKGKRAQRHFKKK
jgi:hypothetical protein